MTLIDFNKKELEDYAQSVLERFSNPFIIHQLESISLNSISKFKVRVLPSLLSYFKKESKVPKNLTFSLAALIYFYGKDVSKHNYQLHDDPKNITFFNSIWRNNKNEKVVIETLSNAELWGENLVKIEPLKENLTQALDTITSHQKISEAYKVFKNLQS